MAGEHLIDARSRAIAAGISAGFTSADQQQVERLARKVANLRMELARIGQCTTIAQAQGIASDALKREFK